MTQLCPRLSWHCPSKPAHTSGRQDTCSIAHALAATALHFQKRRNLRSDEPEILPLIVHSNRARHGCREVSATVYRETGRTERSGILRCQYLRNSVPLAPRVRGWRWLRGDDHRRCINEKLREKPLPTDHNSAPDRWCGGCRHWPQSHIAADYRRARQLPAN